MSEQRRQTRLAKSEALKNGSKLYAIEREFVNKLLLLKVDDDKKVANLENADYEPLFKRYAEMYSKQIKRLTFKYSTVNKKHFHEQFNPIDGTKITATDD